MWRIGPRLVVLALLLGAALALPQAVAAHALPQSSVPAAGSTLASSPSAVTITFGEQPDARLSSIKVLESSGRNVASGPSTAVPGAPLQLTVPLPPLPDGVYTVSWRTVSSVDGHVAAGSFAFGVGVGPPAGGGTGGSSAGSAPPPIPLDASIARWILYLGLIGLLGAAFIAVAAFREPPRNAVRLAGGAWIVAVVGTIAVVAVQWAEADADLATILSSSIGIAAIERIVVILITGVAVLAAVRAATPARSRTALAFVAAGAAAAMLVDVLDGHAAGGSLALLEITAEWTHVLAVGVWIGGLAALLLGVRGAPSEEKGRAVRRFSMAAGISIAVVAVTGFIRAVDEVGSIDALFSTDYGRLIVIKTALFGVLGALGAFNHFFSVPIAARTLTRLRRAGRVEVTVGVVIVLASALLVNATPPVLVGGPATSPAPAPVIAAGSDFGTTIKVRLAVAPGPAGFNAFTAVVTDYDSGAPAPATAVSLRFTIASGSTTVGSSTLALQSSGSGTFAASAGNLSLDGIWNVVAVVTSPSGSVEVPLVVSTRPVGVTVDANVVPGAPTIYTAHLAAGRSLQVYLDPQHAGANELHATFFDAAGTELPVQTVTMAAATADGVGAILSPRQLEPGHFVADTTVATGTLGVDVAGPAPDGAQLHAHIDIDVQP
ncbi:MAG: copper resistance protein CopC [Candidatus Limnocylindrales bacterium]